MSFNPQTVALIASLEKGELSFQIEEGETLGLVTPTYFWGLPSLTAEFLDRVEIAYAGKPGSLYSYVVSTYGTTCGQSVSQAARKLKAKGIRVSARFSVRMPDTWTPVFDLSDPEKVRATNEKAEPVIDQVSQAVSERREGSFLHASLPTPIGLLGYMFYPVARWTGFLSVDGNCIGCGACARKCPVGAIEMRDGMPEWVKTRCSMCLGCLHRCPKFAIHYGPLTSRHGQYQHPGVRI